MSAAPISTFDFGMGAYFSGVEVETMAESLLRIVGPITTNGTPVFRRNEDGTEYYSDVVLVYTRNDDGVYYFRRWGGPNRLTKVGDGGII
jgi:hypothetical protein